MNIIHTARKSVDTYQSREDKLDFDTQCRVADYFVIAIL